MASGLSSPTLVKPAPGDPTRLYVTEQRGTIRIIKNGVLQSGFFLDLRSNSLILSPRGNEQGLLGLAFHPDYQSNGRFFVHYTSGVGGPNTMVQEFRRSAGNADQADATPVGVVFTTPQIDTRDNHQGGSIEFGSDGMLYLGLGDGGSQGDPDDLARNLCSPRGKILRFDVSTVPPAVPVGNLPENSCNPALPWIWDSGLRNPWRMSFDACGGRLYIGDVGGGSREEIDVEEPGAGNRYYGWSCREGFTAADGTHCPGPSPYVDPIVDYSHSASRCSVTGGYVYRGSRIPALRGVYFYADYCTGDVWTLRWSGSALQADDANDMSTAPTLRTADLQSGGYSISSFGQDLAGEVYVVHHGGTVYRIDPM